MNEKQKNSKLETTDFGDLYVFALMTLKPLLNTLESQIEGAAQAADIECIHKMRVTSRRIRATLSVFKSCFPKELSRRWRKEISNITKSLGDARDMDVQIQFLENHLQNLTDEKEKNGVEYLLKKHRERRAEVQPDVVTNLQKLKESGILEEINGLFESVKSRELPISSRSFATYKAAQEHINSRFEDFISLQECVKQENEIKKHHEMRIAAKRLRYTMEIFNQLYDKRLASYISMMKQFQDVLGEMHDCDVWCELIPTVIDELKPIVGDNRSEEESNTEESLRSFLQFIQTRRHTLYTAFEKFWEESNKMFSSLNGLIQYCVVIPSTFQNKIAVISDVHSNLDALQAVLEDARKNGAELILNAGDFVGYGAFPNEVVTELNSENVLSVLGNYDEEALEWKKKNESSQIDEKEISLDYVVSNLQKPSFQFLNSLPKRIILKIGEKSIFLVHGSPESIDEHIYPDTPEQRLNELGKQANSDVVIVGHSHMSFVRTANHVMFVNPGSVGRPGDGDIDASYALLTVKPFSFEIKKVKYDVMRAVDALRQRRLPEHFAQMLLQGISLENLIQQELTKTSQKKGVFGHSILDTWKNQKKKRQIKKVVQRYIPDYSHALQVTRNALSIFDQLRSIHPLGPEDRFWLECASLLHDIGLSHGAKGHHKTSFRLILTDPFLPLNARQRQMISIIARYHRKNPPAMYHVPFKDLNIIDRTRVELLASMLRVADGLDASHCSVVEKLDMEISDTSVMMRCLVNGNTQLEEEMLNKKKDLFEKVFNRSLLTTMQDPSIQKEKLSGS